MAMNVYSVTLDGPAPWGFRLQGGKDFSMPLTVSKYTINQYDGLCRNGLSLVLGENLECFLEKYHYHPGVELIPGGKSDLAGVGVGDWVVSIGDSNAEEMTHVEAQNKIRSATDTLTLTLSRAFQPGAGEQKGSHASAPTQARYSFSPSARINKMAQPFSTAASNASAGPIIRPVTYVPKPCTDAPGPAPVLSSLPTASTPRSHNGRGEGFYEELYHENKHGLRAENMPCFIPNDRSKKRLIEDTQDWQPRTGITQSRSFRILAQLTGTDYSKQLGPHCNGGPWKGQLVTRLCRGPVLMNEGSEPAPTADVIITFCLCFCLLLPFPWSPPCDAVPYARGSFLRNGSDREKFLSEIQSPRYARLRDWHHDSHGVAPCPSKTKPAAKPEGSRALGPAGPSCRPPWVTDPGFADRYRPDKTSTVVTQHSQRAEPTPEQSRCSIVQAALQGPAHGASSARTPLCVACSKVIRGRYVVALGRSWHPEEFVCCQCRAMLDEGGFFEEQGSIYCTVCYDNRCAPKCAKCKKKITGEIMHALKMTYHVQCFVCAACKKPIRNQAFYMEEGEPYCERDYEKMFGTKCHGCDFKIDAGDRFLEALGYSWHDTCFVCALCNINLEGKTFYSKKDKPLCKGHAFSAI
ncbi:hypothetical protein P4O66_000647 [Electrophorus voltai]|uniref:PDZ and LIM domain protein 7 n=1 Tax=Electrophorus voltai TaxID=2609070 RepID=A0AAD9DYY1_9TELE|nr:hypothetical protein P4O66_000647 [Electrophorus voltai]